MPTLRFKDLHKAEYIIVSKDGTHDEPLSGPSQFAKEVEGLWYKFNLHIHEYQYLDDDANKHVVKNDPPELVGYFDGDNQYKNAQTGEFFKSQGTILKHLFATPAGVKFKISMVENDKGKKVYVVENIDEVSEDVTPASPTPAVPLLEKVKQLKDAGMTVEAMLPTLEKEYTDATPDMVKTLYGAC